MPSRTLVVAARVLLLLLAAGAVVAAAVMTSHDRLGAAGTVYACPMHPDVRTAERRECPICGMALEPVGRDSAAVTAPSRRDLAAVENVRQHNIVDFVRKRSLLPNERELRGPAWVERDGIVTAILYRDQIEALGTEEPGSFSLTRSPKVTFPVRRTADPAVRWDDSTSQVRFRLDPARAAHGDLAPQPGEVGWLELAPKPRQVLTVPTSALLQSPEGPYVLASVGGFRFEKRPVEIGETFLKQGFAVVLSGVRANDRVVARATFFVDADRRVGDAGDLGWGTP